ncbi:MFS transporter [Chromobacterium subtsugae]|uniref:MFS transporter n=1 Tax=Chromobacterium subtsugae TaxID=251747 RepID=A0ABS7F8H0_9NEIS|nr:MULTISPECIES: MdfA family multidrug efflux MFS transporter [Chromobacterium]KUM03941.1 MFS transporter [Chromobacterium subtsugae]KZE86641.1 MFS transporter [Chromobacterium sp. F49]MBW7565086.1 MFS transporter [Chromobacterium subtsugae]MBW8286386.1 MFS transporter [Chromobacterium subtsugae]WSE91570.1 MFS transporter [Chromobacterium subtsugae]
MPAEKFRPLLAISRRQALCFCLLLTAFELLTYLASDMVMPAMLQVTRDLDADSRHVPTALNAFLLGGIALQWLIGPLSDRFGRRPLLLAGVLGFAAACAAAAGAQQIESFNLLRFAQGTALGFVIVVSYPALQETFAEEDAVRLMALLANIALLSPLAGPLLGGLLLKLLSWRQLFAALAAAALLVALGLWRLMPETVGAPRRDGPALPPTPLRLKAALANYLGLLRHRTVLCGSLALGLITLPLIAWIGLSPLLLIRQLGYSNLEYGLWQLPVFGGVIAGNLALNRLAGRQSLARLLRLSLAPMACGLLLTGILTPLHPTLPTLAAGLAVYAFGLGLGNATLYRLTLYASDSAKGSVAAVLGILSTATLGAGAALLAWLNAGDSPQSFAVGVTAAALLAAPPLWLLLRAPQPQASAA